MTQIYTKSFAFFFASLPALLAFAAVIEGLLWVFRPKSEGVVVFGALLIIAYYFHRHFLFGEGLALGKLKPAPDAPPQKFGWFLLISFLMVFVPGGIAVVIAINATDELGLGILMLTLFPLYLIALGLFGTALPASVAQDGTYRLSQGLRVSFPTMGRLILGPGVVGLVVVAAVLLAGQPLARLNLAEDSLVLLGWYILIRTLGFLSTILAVAVLCDMYRRTRPGPVTGLNLPDQRPA